MNKERIVNNLKILGINSKSQLEKNEIDFWWEKKYIEIQRSGENNKVISELLIQLNEAKEYLNEIDETKIKKFFNEFFEENNKFPKSYNKNKLKINSNNNTEEDNSIKIIDNYYKFENKNNKKNLLKINDTNEVNLKFAKLLSFSIIALGLILFLLANNNIIKNFKIRNAYNLEKKLGINRQNEIFFYSNGKYIGGYLNGLRHGNGLYIWDNGDSYDGDWINNERHGKGTYTWASGDEYIGEWRYGKKHGKGIYTLKNGEKYEEEWRHGKQIK